MKNFVTLIYFSRTLIIFLNRFIIIQDQFLIIFTNIFQYQNLKDFWIFHYLFFQLKMLNLNRITLCMPCL